MSVGSELAGANTDPDPPWLGSRVLAAAWPRVYPAPEVHHMWDVLKAGKQNRRFYIE